LGLFWFSLTGHWWFGWFAYVGDQEAHGQPIDFASYAVLMGRDTLENWQSEFRQLLWQVDGLDFFLFSARRNRATVTSGRKPNWMPLSPAGPRTGAQLIADLDKTYPRR